MTDWLRVVLTETFWGSLGIIRILVIVLVPLMIFMQFLLDYKWLEKASHKLKPVAGFFGLGKDALIPLLVGVFAGISYGAGVIIFAKEKYQLPRADVFLILCFLVMCHGVIDTSIIFMPLGVSPAAVLPARFAMAILLTLFFKGRAARKFQRLDF